MSKLADLREDLSRLRRLPERVRALETAVQENRVLNRRVAELLDVVTELLVPIADRDEEKVNEVLAKYRELTFTRGG